MTSSLGVWSLSEEIALRNVSVTVIKKTTCTLFACTVPEHSTVPWITHLGDARENASVTVGVEVIVPRGTTLPFGARQNCDKYIKTARCVVCWHFPGLVRHLIKNRCIEGGITWNNFTNSWLRQQVTSWVLYQELRRENVTTTTTTTQIIVYNCQCIQIYLLLLWTALFWQICSLPARPVHEAISDWSISSNIV